MLAGSQLAHGLAYRLAYPQLHVRVQVLAASGHGYSGQLRLVCGLLGAVALCLLVWGAFDGLCAGPPRPAPPLVFAILPPLGFTVQELVERWQVVGGLPWWMVLEPTFRIGLALQVPFGLAAFLVAHLLLRAAHRLAGRSVRRDAPPRSAEPRFLPSPREDVERLAGSAVPPSSLSRRGPPLLAR
jgi:hypothetical protein